MSAENSPARTAPAEGRDVQCGDQALPFASWAWFDELAMLLARYAGPLGISPELTGFTLIEVWGHYQWLRGMGSVS